MNNYQPSWVFVNLHVEIHRQPDTPANRMTIQGFPHEYWIDVNNLFYRFAVVLTKQETLNGIIKQPEYKVVTKIELATDKYQTFEFQIPQVAFDDFVSYYLSVKNIVSALKPQSEE
jgi:hypothetical protein